MLLLHILMWRTRSMHALNIAKKKILGSQLFLECSCQDGTQDLWFGSKWHFLSCQIWLQLGEKQVFSYKPKVHQIKIHFILYYFFILFHTIYLDPSLTSLSSQYPPPSPPTDPLLLCFLSEKSRSPSDINKTHHNKLL